MRTERKLLLIVFQFVILGLFASCASTGHYRLMENNRFNPAEFATEKLTVQIHRVLGPWCHASIRITLDSEALVEKYGNEDRFVKTDENGNKYITLGAGPNHPFFFSRLKAGVNRPKDANDKIKVETYNYYFPKENKMEVIEKIIAAFKAYDNGLRFSFFPGKANERFNSNSFVTGLLLAAGLEAPRFSEKYKIPGYNKPAPLFASQEWPQEHNGIFEPVGF